MKECCTEVNCQQLLVTEVFRARVPAGTGGDSEGLCRVFCKRTSERQVGSRERLKYIKLYSEIFSRVHAPRFSNPVCCILGPAIILLSCF